MEKQEVLNHLLEKTQEIIAYVEEHCDDEQLHGEGLYAMLYIRYENALSLLREASPGYSKLRAGLQFLISANRAYIGSTSDWEDPLRNLLSESDRWIDRYLQDDKSEH
ncbi:MAG: hypothetical protein PHE47_06145 [Oscillospiraceae bacterium]|nr:hypothetical protein [Oscillospiraceae bacterium]